MSAHIIEQGDLCLGAGRLYVAEYVIPRNGLIVWCELDFTKQHVFAGFRAALIPACWFTVVVRGFWTPSAEKQAAMEMVYNVLPEDDHWRGFYGNDGTKRWERVS